MDNRLSTPLEKKRRRFFLSFFGAKDSFRVKNELQSDFAGRISERIADFLGTPTFIVWLTVFCVAWLGWNTLVPDALRFDSASLGFTALTLILSLQASYAAPLILFAQNRQADRDKVQIENDRIRAERNLADTEYLAREIATIRLALESVATRDYIKNELRDILKELDAEKSKS
jgi:uncharacterized membrane protein